MVNLDNAISWIPNETYQSRFSFNTSTKPSILLQKNFLFNKTVKWMDIITEKSLFTFPVKKQKKRIIKYILCQERRKKKINRSITKYMFVLKYYENIQLERPHFRVSYLIFTCKKTQAFHFFYGISKKKIWSKAFLYRCVNIVFFFIYIIIIIIMGTSPLNGVFLKLNILKILILQMNLWFRYSMS